MAVLSGTTNGSHTVKLILFWESEQKTMQLRRYLARLSVMAALLVVGQTSQSQIVYEGFNPTFPNYHSGTGLTNAWLQDGFNVSAADYAASESSLSYAGLQTSGGSISSVAVFQISGATRTLAQPLGADNSTVYLSFLVQPQGTLDEGLFNGFFGLTLNGSLGDDLFIGKPGGPREYVLETRGGSGQVSSGSATVIGETALLVVKAEFRAGNDIFTLYANPTPGDPEPSDGVVKSDLDLGTVSKIGIYSTGAFSIDEIRVGATYADVVPTGLTVSSLSALKP